MGIIAIAANPASGRDIRRLVSHATVYSNRDKANIIERVILSAAQMGGHKILIMPDSYCFGRQIIEHLESDLKAIPVGTISIPDLDVSDKQEDTTAFAAYANEKKAAALIVIGGDGTNRAAAKTVGTIPLIPLSTGTNNVYPEMIEGTTVGLAASALAEGAIKPEDCCHTSKRIEIWRNGVFVDIALIDVVFSNHQYIGSKAIWEMQDITRVMVSQCHPSFIGFSALLGGTVIINSDDDYGAVADCSLDAPNCRASLAVGVISNLNLSNLQTIPIGHRISYRMSNHGILALDGEREVSWSCGDLLEFIITRNGPRKVNVRQALEAAQKAGYFLLPQNRKGWCL